MAIKVVNPSTGEVVKTYDRMKTHEIGERIRVAENAYTAWRQTAMGERTECLRRAATLLDRGKHRYTELMALEMGKPVRDGRAEIEKCAWLCRHVAETGAQMLAPEIIKTDA